MTTGSEFYKSLSHAQTGGDYQKSRWDTPMGRAHFETTRRTIVEKAFPLARGMRTFLEVGAGPATWTRYFVETHPDAQFTLVDISEEMLAQARQALQNGAVEYIHSDFMEYVSDHHVDFFFSSRALEYFENKAGFAQKVASLLRPDGTGFVITKCGHPARDAIRGRKLPERHAHQTTPHFLKKEFERAGLEITGMGIAAVTTPILHSPFLNTLLWKIMRYFPSFLAPTFIAESFWISFKKV